MYKYGWVDRLLPIFNSMLVAKNKYFTYLVMVIVIVLEIIADLTQVT